MQITMLIYNQYKLVFFTKIIDKIFALYILYALYLYQQKRIIVIKLKT